MVRVLGRLLLFLILSALMAACATKGRTPVAKVYRDTALSNPGSYHLKFLPSGQGTLAEYLSREKTKDPELKDFNLVELEKLLRKAYPQLYRPVGSGSPLCNLETNYRHCKGIEILVDLSVYADNTVVLRNYLFYHVDIRVERDQPNIYMAVKTQRDRGDLTLPPGYEIESLVDTLRRDVPILQEIASNYSKYIKNNNQELEIAIILEVNPARMQEQKKDQGISKAAEIGGQTAMSIVQGASFLANLTLSTLYAGGKTFWEVLKEESEFDLYKQSLALNRVEFSYSGSFARNMTKSWRKLAEPGSDILIRNIVIRLRDREAKSAFQGSGVVIPGKTSGLQILIDRTVITLLNGNYNR